MNNIPRENDENLKELIDKLIDIFNGKKKKGLKNKLKPYEEKIFVMNISDIENIFNALSLTINGDENLSFLDNFIDRINELRNAEDEKKKIKEEVIKEVDDVLNDEKKNTRESHKNIICESVFDIINSAYYLSYGKKNMSAYFDVYQQYISNLDNKEILEDFLNTIDNVLYAPSKEVLFVKIGRDSKRYEIFQKIEIMILETMLSHGFITQEKVNQRKINQEDFVVSDVDVHIKSQEENESVSDKPENINENPNKEMYDPFSEGSSDINFLLENYGVPNSKNDEDKDANVATNQSSDSEEDSTMSISSEENSLPSENNDSKETKNNTNLLSKNASLEYVKDYIRSQKGLEYTLSLIERAHPGNHPDLAWQQAFTGGIHNVLPLDGGNLLDAFATVIVKNANGQYDYETLRKEAHKKFIEIESLSIIQEFVSRDTEANMYNSALLHHMPQEIPETTEMSREFKNILGEVIDSLDTKTGRDVENLTFETCDDIYENAEETDDFTDMKTEKTSINQLKTDIETNNNVLYVLGTLQNTYKELDQKKIDLEKAKSAVQPPIQLVINNLEESIINQKKILNDKYTISNIDNLQAVDYETKKIQDQKTKKTTELEKKQILFTNQMKRRISKISLPDDNDNLKTKKFLEYLNDVAPYSGENNHEALQEQLKFMLSSIDGNLTDSERAWKLREYGQTYQRLTESHPGLLETLPREFEEKMNNLGVHFEGMGEVNMLLKEYEDIERNFYNDVRDNKSTVWLNVDDTSFEILNTKKQELKQKVRDVLGSDQKMHDFYEHVDKQRRMKREYIATLNSENENDLQRLKEYWQSSPEAFTERDQITAVLRSLYGGIHTDGEPGIDDETFNRVADTRVAFNKSMDIHHDLDSKTPDVSFWKKSLHNFSGNAIKLGEYLQTGAVPQMLHKTTTGLLRGAAHVSQFVGEPLVKGTFKYGSKIAGWGLEKLGSTTNWLPNYFGESVKNTLGEKGLWEKMKKSLPAVAMLGGPALMFGPFAAVGALGALGAMKLTGSGSTFAGGLFDKGSEKIDMNTKTINNVLKYMSDDKIKNLADVTGGMWNGLSRFASHTSHFSLVGLPRFATDYMDTKQRREFISKSIAMNKSWGGFRKTLLLSGFGYELDFQTSKRSIDWPWTISQPKKPLSKEVDVKELEKQMEEVEKVEAEEVVKENSDGEDKKAA
jgi:hypothetical protein